MAKISRCALPLHFRCTSVARTGGPSKAVAVAFRVSYTRMLQRQRASRCTGPLHFSLERNHCRPLHLQRRLPSHRGPFVILRPRPPPWSSNIIGPPRQGDHRTPLERWQDWCFEWENHFG